MNTIMSILGIVASLCMFKWREKIGEAVGDAPWMHKLGGVYGVIMISATIIFFFSISSLFGTNEIFFSPIIGIFEGFGGGPPPADSTRF